MKMLKRTRIFIILITAILFIPMISTVSATNIDNSKVEVEVLKVEVEHLEDEINNKLDKIEIENLDRKLDEINIRIDQVSENISGNILEKIIKYFVGFISIVGIAGVFGFIKYIKKLVDDRILEILESRNSQINEWIKNSDEESNFRRESKILIISNDIKGQNCLRDLLNNVFDITDSNGNINLEFKLLKDVSFEELNTNQQVLADYSKYHMIFLDNSSLELEGNLQKNEEVKNEKIYGELVSLMNKKINKNKHKTCWLYFNENRVILKPEINEHVGFANSKSTIYSNVMGLLKYRKYMMS